MTMFCRGKGRQQISGEGKWRLRESVENGACFPLGTTVHMTSLYVANVKNAQLPTGRALRSQHNRSGVSNAPGMWVRRYTAGAPSEGRLDVRKALKFSVGGRWIGYSPSPAAPLLPLSSARFPGPIYYWEIIPTASSSVISAWLFYASSQVFILSPGLGAVVYHCIEHVTVLNTCAWLTAVWWNQTKFWNDSLDLFCKQ